MLMLMLYNCLVVCIISTAGCIAINILSYYLTYLMFDYSQSAHPGAALEIPGGGGGTGSRDGAPGGMFERRS